MTEKEKSEQGLLHDANYDKEILGLRGKCKDLCLKFNQALPSDIPMLEKLFKTIVGSVGANFVVTQPFQCDLGYNIHIGNDFYCYHNLIILDGAKVNIGNNVWIGVNVTILPGVTIGKGSIIGAGSVVSKDIPPKSIAVGNPCRILRKITEEDKNKYKK